MNFINLIDLYSYSIFDDIVIPDGVNKETLINTILDKCRTSEPLYTDEILLKMKIKFKTKYLKKCLTNRKTCLKEFGNLTDTIKRKLDTIQSATSIQELFQISGHLHELRHHAKGVYGLTIKHPYRLLQRA